MKYNLLTMLACGILAASSCTTIKKSATTAEVQNGIYQYPTVADLDIHPKVEVSKSWNFIPFHWGEPSVSLAKGNLIAETVKENNADILLEPQVIFTKTSFGKRKLIITGYPASFKNFRKATEADLEALKSCPPRNERTEYNAVPDNIFSKILR